MSAAGTRSGGRSRPARKRAARARAISTAEELEQYVNDLKVERKKLEDERVQQIVAAEAQKLGVDVDAVAVSPGLQRNAALYSSRKMDVRGSVWRRDAGYPSIPFCGSPPVMPRGVLVLPASLDRMDREPSIGANMWMGAFPGEESEYPICVTFDPLEGEMPRPTGALVANSLDAALRAPRDSAWMSNIGSPWETVIVDLQQVGGQKHGSIVAVEGDVAALLRRLRAKCFVVVVGCEGLAELDGRSCAALLELFAPRGDAGGRGGRRKAKAARNRAKRSAAAAAGAAGNEGQDGEEEEERGRSLRVDLEARLSEEELRDLLRVFTVE